ncbi:Hsp60 -like chaperone (ATpase) [Cryptosporidium bovis]|uniref:Hsp60 -like chaperone (ATpase) n=1 Tax=Cryptosporidium bovis TaxID=310047 RepID=UPI00351A8DAF|nr:Hsp60 -like chaperone (ATpase) [Cryptosporidium bovis]
MNGYLKTNYGLRELYSLGNGGFGGIINSSLRNRVGFIGTGALNKASIGLVGGGIMRKMMSRLGKFCYNTGKDLQFGNVSRRQMLKGANILADAVGVTLGPKGRNVVIDQGMMKTPRITKDGVTVARSIEFKSKPENIGAQLLKNVALATNDKAGDGTTTATVLAREMYRSGCDKVDSGLNPMDLLRGINIGVEYVISELDKLSQPVKTREDILNVATISANNDLKIGKIISKAYDKVGRDGTIHIVEGNTTKCELNVVEGIKIDRGYISPYFITNQKNQKVELENPNILIFNGKISDMNLILPVLEHSLKTNSPILIIADDIEGEALAALILNKIQLNLKLCAIKSPGFGEHKKQLLNDLSAILGAKIINGEYSSDNVSDINSNNISEYLGQCKSVSISKEETIITEGKGSSSSKVRDIISLVKHQMDEANRNNLDLSEYEKKKLSERYAKLTGKIAIIKVGGYSDTEISELKDRFVDSLNATKCALEQGIVPGGGSALIWASRNLKDLYHFGKQDANNNNYDKIDNYDVAMGIKIVEDACKIPCSLISSNAGFEGPVVVGELIKKFNNGDKFFGFNARNGKFVDMIKNGIIDPTKVVKSGISNAASIASLMATTEVSIYDSDMENSNTDIYSNNRKKIGRFP